MSYQKPINPTDAIPFTPEERRKELFERIAQDSDALADYADMMTRHALRGNETMVLAHAKLCAGHLRDIGAIYEMLQKVRPSDESFEYGH
jgi:hypothetical protein